VAGRRWRPSVRLSVTLLLLATAIRGQSLQVAFRAVARIDGVAGFKRVVCSRFRRALCSRSKHQEKGPGKLGAIRSPCEPYHAFKNPNKLKIPELEVKVEGEDQGARFKKMEPNQGDASGLFISAMHFSFLWFSDPKAP